MGFNPFRLVNRAVPREKSPDNLSGNEARKDGKTRVKLSLPVAALFLVLRLTGRAFVPSENKKRAGDCSGSIPQFTLLCFNNKIQERLGQWSRYPLLRGARPGAHQSEKVKFCEWSFQMDVLSCPIASRIAPPKRGEGRACSVSKWSIERLIRHRALVAVAILIQSTLLSSFLY